MQETEAEAEAEAQIDGAAIIMTATATTTAKEEAGKKIRTEMVTTALIIMTITSTVARALLVIHPLIELDCVLRVCFPSLVTPCFSFLFCEFSNMRIIICVVALTRQRKAEETESQNAYAWKERTDRYKDK
jgi:hypothetical protein